MRNPRSALVRTVLLVALGGAALAGCSSDDFSGSTTLEAGDIAGQWTEASSKPTGELKLEDGGSVSGTDGCNQLNGTWKIDGSDVEFGPFAATMMACADVDTWLSGATSATVDGDEMTVLDEGGKEIGTLTKA